MNTATPTVSSTCRPSKVRWRTSSRSSGGGACVEVYASTAAVRVRDTKDRGGPVLVFSPGAWARFLTGLPAPHHTD